MQIIDGYCNEPNIYADDIGEYNTALWGSGDCVLPAGEQLGYELVSNNEVKIKDGIFVTQGRRGVIKKGTTESCTIENGTQAENRNDLIVIEYAKDPFTLVESHTLKVLQGTPGESAVDPDVVTGDIQAGDVLHQMPLYRVKLEGLNVVAVEQMFIIGKLALNMDDVLEEMSTRMERTENDINTMKAEIEEVKQELTSPSFKLNETIVIYGTGANTTLVPEWTGSSVVSVGQNASGSGTIVSSTSVDMRSVKSITAFQSMYNHPGCSSHNDYKYCGYIASYGIMISLYDSTNTTLIKECASARNSCVLDTSDVSEMCYIRVTHHVAHNDLGYSTSTITKVSLTV